MTPLSNLSQQAETTLLHIFLNWTPRHWNPSHFIPSHTPQIAALRCRSVIALHQISRRYVPAPAVTTVVPRVTLLRRQSLDKVDKVLKSFRSDWLRNATAARKYLNLSQMWRIISTVQIFKIRTQTRLTHIFLNQRDNNTKHESCIFVFMTYY